ncbi:Uncharacterized protein dnm_009390 [Desulfonema magnum]|uniref:Uncharacterized protein n=1 Tax=Desulfonema magnum TaxID=45655 RepID=A0A975BGG6_9BACT|nr:Uncharacterized protein dnm_009390 [Desulfonema magnum]
MSRPCPIPDPERIRSAKIIFLRLRKSIFRTPENGENTGKSAYS